MKNRILKITVFTLLMTFGVYAQKKQSNESIKQKIDNYLSQGVTNGFSGSVLVAKKGTIIINKGYGLANKEENIANSPNTVFTIGSVTKQFTATAILKLEELDKLNTTDPLHKFFKNIPYDKKDITIHQLLTHSSGFIDVIGEGDFDYIKTKVFFKRLFKTELIHKPGHKYAYSNAGYSVLARIIELVSNEDYESFLNKYLFKPAGMQQTGYLIPRWNNKQIAVGYAYNVENMGTLIDRFKRKNRVTWTLKGNGGINSTTKDMCKWYEALKNNKILSKSSFEKLTTPYILEYEGKSSYYAYGWAIYKSDRNTKIISHNGGNRIFFHDFIWLPKEDVVVIFFTNANSKEVEVAWNIKSMVLDNGYKPKPIKKNSRLLISEFVKNNNTDKSEELMSILKRKYSSDIEDPNLLNSIGYSFLENEVTIDWAVEIFEINTALFPNQGNNWDSLGDGYKKIGDKDNAILAYKKAIELNPNIRESINSLKELGVKIKGKKEISVSISILNEYIGEYELKPGFIINISTKKGKLIASSTGRPSMIALPQSDIKFFLKEANSYILFNKSDTVKIISLSLIDGSNEMIAKRI